MGNFITCTPYQILLGPSNKRMSEVSVAHIQQTRNTYKFSVRRHKEKRPLGKPRHG